MTGEKKGKSEKTTGTTTIKEVGLQLISCTGGVLDLKMNSFLSSHDNSLIEGPTAGLQNGRFLHSLYDTGRDRVRT